jgi:hypothetical protein
MAAWISFSLVNGAQYTFHCQSKNDSNKNTTLQWYKDDIEIQAMFRPESWTFCKARFGSGRFKKFNPDPDINGASPQLWRIDYVNKYIERSHFCTVPDTLKGQCHKMVVEVRPWSGSLALN